MEYIPYTYMVMAGFVYMVCWTIFTKSWLQRKEKAHKDWEIQVETDPRNELDDLDLDGDGRADLRTGENQNNMHDEAHN